MKKLIPLLALSVLFAEGCMVSARVRGPRHPRRHHGRVIIRGSAMNLMPAAGDPDKGCLRYFVRKQELYC